MVEIDYMLDPGWKFLRQPEDQQLQERAARRFDNKTHTWVPDPVEGFVIASIAVEEGNSYTLTMPDGSTKKMGKDECQEINPAKFEKTEDMSCLTFLNEASVLHNLRQRYYSMMIYVSIFRLCTGFCHFSQVFPFKTYSGLFCVFINPYKMLPIYTDSVQAMYVNKRRTEMPPHLFAVSDEAFRNMMTDHENQSMLITGESGAGKTENTKKVIAYFANIGGNKETSSAQRAVRFKDLGVSTTFIPGP
ncbi:myosin SH3-like domain protein [Ancylostoma caninum]|uniref:Myosin SH3-like domain protein n=1 Tax=Ancylostoma caninum TaxID=29170 RepID=A0A368H7J2_ANCCA|nr:myosin SH3-like domain protein [Ancylostoma caninum]